MMVPIKLIGDIKEFEDGLQLILPDLSLEISDSGIPVTVQKGDSLVAKLSADSGCISYAKKVQFFRALSHLSQHGVGCNVEEQGGFEHNGVMIDLTCNNVMKPETLRYFFRKMALMGLDLAVIQQLMEVPEYPYYGYMRGRYSADEMKQIDDYAYTFGIEVVPCIQTLGHLERELHWNHMNPISDTPQVLFVGEDETYRFIEACLKAVTAPYRSKRVHIGMDEAWNVGFGKYLRKHGYRETADIMKDHLSRIHEILDRMGLHAMMWSDMYFRSISPTDDYYDLTAEIPQKILDSAPSDVDLVYWHYCETEENTYKEMIKRHQRFKAKTIYAGGICTWLGPTPRYDFTINPTVFALRQCRELGVSEVFATLWGDDCAECNLLTGLYGMQLYAEMDYTGVYDEKALGDRFRACVGADPKAFTNLSKFDTVDVAEGEYGKTTPSKFLLYQDPILPLFEKDCEGWNFSDYYADLKTQYETYRDENPSFRLLFDFYVKFADMLSKKSAWHEQAGAIIRAKDHAKAKELADSAPAIIASIRALKDIWRDLWYSTRKIQGFEVIDQRMGIVLIRMESAERRMRLFADGKIDTIEELEVKKLPVTTGKNGKLGMCNNWKDICTPSSLW